MNTLWQEEEFERESFKAEAADVGKTNSVKEHAKERYDFNPTMLYENRFWNRRPDGIVINKNYQKLCILEFKRSSDRNEDFLRVKEDETNEQHKSIIEALKVAAPKWTFEQIKFVTWCSTTEWKMISITSSKCSMYKQRKNTMFYWHMCNAYAKRITK